MTLHQERLEFDNHVDKLQTMIKNKRKEYADILAMNKDAEAARDSAKEELMVQVHLASDKSADSDSEIITCKVASWRLNITLHDTGHVKN